MVPVVNPSTAILWVTVDLNSTLSGNKLIDCKSFVQLSQPVKPSSQGFAPGAPG